MPCTHSTSQQLINRYDTENQTFAFYFLLPSSIATNTKDKPSRLSWRIRWGQWKLENAHQWYLRLLLAIWYFYRSTQLCHSLKINKAIRILRTKQLNSALLGKLCYLRVLAFFCHFLSPPTLVMSTNKGRRITAFSAFFLWHAQKGCERSTLLGRPKKGQ